MICQQGNIYRVCASLVSSASHRWTTLKICRAILVPIQSHAAVDAEIFSGHPGVHSVSRGRGRPSRRSQPIVTPESNQSASSYNRRRCTQLRNTVSTEERTVHQRLIEESSMPVSQPSNLTSTHNRTSYLLHL